MTWWFCADQDNAEKYVWIDTERWFDARRTAWTILGSEKLWITHPKTDHTRPPKKAYVDRAVYVAHWEGSAAGLNNLRMEVDRVLMRKMICTSCFGLVWPWDVQEFGGALIHKAISMGEEHDCGPVVLREKKAEARSPNALPDALPYEDEKTNGTTPVSPA